MRAVVLLLLFAALAALLTACDDPEPSIGLTLNTSNELVILYNPCNDDKLVRSVELQTPRTTIWHIESDEGSSLREFVVGEEPDGFRTTVPLAVSLEGQRLLVQISGIGIDYFSFSDLKGGQVVVIRRGTMSHEEFWARDTCGRGGLF